MQANHALNDELVALKARLLTMLRKRRLPNMPCGYPFHLVPTAGTDGYSLSQSSYEFSEYIFVDQWTAPSYAVFSYTAPGYGHTSQGGPPLMTWRINIPSRESLRPNQPVTCESCQQETFSPILTPSDFTVAQVQIDPVIMETAYGLELMTNPHMVLEALSASLEQGVHINVQLATSMVSDDYSRRLGIRYRPGDLLFVAKKNNGEREIVHVYSP